MVIDFERTAKKKQEAFEKCWAHSPLRAAARLNFTLPFTRCRYCRTPPLSLAACASMSTTTTMTTTTTTRDRGDRYGPMEWAQSAEYYIAHRQVCRAARAGQIVNKWQYSALTKYQILESAISKHKMTFCASKLQKKRKLSHL